MQNPEQKQSIKLTIFGNLLSKSNSRVFTTFGGRPRLLKAPKAISYVNAAILQVKSELRLATGFETYEGPVRMVATIWYSSRRPDLDVSLLQDVLEKAGVYKNDRQVHEIVATKKLDKENPRVEVEIIPL